MTDEPLTWEDVFAVCKLMKVQWVETGFSDGSYTVYRSGAFGTSFTDPTAALEFITAEEHPLEMKYARILRTKP